MARRKLTARSMSSTTWPSSSSSSRRRSAATSVQRPIASIASCSPARAAVSGLLASCAMTDGSAASSRNGSTWGFGACAAASRRSSRPRHSPVSSSVRRSRLRRSRPSGGGAGGRGRTGAITQGTLRLAREPTQRPPCRMGTFQRRSVESRSTLGPATEPASLHSFGSSWARAETSNRVTGRPSATLACRRISRRPSPKASVSLTPTPVGRSKPERLRPSPAAVTMRRQIRLVRGALSYICAAPAVPSSNSPPGGGVCGVMSSMVGGSPLLRVVAALAAAPLAAQQPAGAWDSVARALGRSGPAGGETYRATFPRTDLQVSVSGVRIAPALALTSWAAFAGSPDSADVMGDLVLAEGEVADVVAALLDGGLDVTAIHHHLLGESPRVLYVHYHGRGRGVVLATKLRMVLARTATPLEPGAASRTPNGALRATLDTAAIFETLGLRGRIVSEVAQFGVATSGSRVTLGGRPVPLALGMATAINLQPLSATRALATGDFVLAAERVAPVVQALTAMGIHVTALHNHLVGEEPRAYFVHFWGDGEPVALAKGLRAALDAAR